MKRTLSAIIFAIAFLVLAHPPGAQAGKQKWTFRTSGISAYTVDPTGTTHVATSSTTNYIVSGNTTPVKQTLDTGTSMFVLHHGPNPRELKGQHYTVDISDSTGIFMARITDLDPAQAHYPADGFVSSTTDYSSGTTAWFFAKVAWENTEDAFNKAEYIPIIPAEAPNSGTSTTPRFFKVEPANYMRVYGLWTGVTPFGYAEIEIASGFPEADWARSEPFVIDHEILVINADSGVSTLTVPEGTRNVFITTTDDIYYTLHGEDPSDDNGQPLSESQTLQLPKKLAEGFKFTRSDKAVDSGVTLTAIHMNK